MKVSKAKPDPGFIPSCVRWGITLSKESGELSWIPDVDLAKRFINGRHELILDQISLGHEAQPGEVNVVEVRGPGYKQAIQIPLLIATGGVDVAPKRLRLKLDAPVWFRLIEGNGPVHITGVHVVNSMTCASLNCYQSSLRNDA